MSLALQGLFSSSHSRVALRFTPSLKSPNVVPPISSHQLTAPPSINRSLVYSPSIVLKFSSYPSNFSLRAYDSTSHASEEQAHNSDDFNIDSFLSFAEVLCILSSVIISVAFAVNYAVFGWKGGVLGEIWRRVLALGAVGLVGGVGIGTWIRRRQWRRICVQSTRGGGESLNLVERIEKLEEDLRSSVTIVRVLSRQLEKLGIRFRVTRKALRKPLEETAALAQKNFEATRELAVQEDILEKELGEIQKVLLAMQEQQQKQLELILAIGKSGKLWESKRESSREQNTLETPNLEEETKQVEIPPAQTTV